MSESDPARPDDFLDRPAAAGAPPGAQVIDHHKSEEPRAVPPPLPAAGPAPRVVRRGGTPFIVTLLLVAGVAGAGFYAWTHPAPAELLATDVPTEQAGQAGQTDQLKADQSKTDQLKAELQAQIQAAQQSATQAASQAATQAGTAAAGQAIGPLHDQIAALADRVDKLEKAPAPAAEAPAPAAPPSTGPAMASADEVTTLGQHVDQLSAKIDGLSARQDAAAQAPAPAPAAPASAPQPDHTAIDAATSAQAQVAALQGKVDQLEQAQKAALTQADEQQTAAISQAEEQQKASFAQQQEQQKAAIAQADEQQKAALAQTAEQQKAVIDALTARLAKLEQGTGRIASEADLAARAARADALQAALAAGKPLGDIPDAPPALAQFEKTAPPTEDGLRAAFPHVAADARAASRPADAQHSFWSRALARMQQTVVVRQGDQVIIGDPAAGVLARATDDVNRGDLRAAVQALGALQGPAAAAVAGWVGQVRNLLDARAALSAMAAVH